MTGGGVATTITMLPTTCRAVLGRDGASVVDFTVGGRGGVVGGGGGDGVVDGSRRRVVAITIESRSGGVVDVDGLIVGGAGGDRHRPIAG